jgi:hypothetical protein
MTNIIGTLLISYMRQLFYNNYQEGFQEVKRACIRLINKHVNPGIPESLSADRQARILFSD